MHTLDSAELDAYARLLRRIDPQLQLVHAERLTGGISANATRIWTDATGDLHDLVVRRHGIRDRRRDKFIAWHEFELLQLLRAHDIPVATPIYAEREPSEFPEQAIVITYVEGSTEIDEAHLPAAMQAMGEILAKIHRVPVDACFDHLRRSDRPYGPPTGPLDEQLGEAEIRAALDATPIPAGDPTLLHNDFWPGNVLWRDGELVAVIDWEDAVMRHPLQDVGNTRMELTFFYGPDAAEQFAAAYATASGADMSGLPYYDLHAALRPCGRLDTYRESAADEPELIIRHRRFANMAVEALANPFDR